MYTHVHTHNTHTHMHAHNSYIPQTEQHEPEGRMLFCLGNVTNLLDGNPSNPLPHLHPFHFVLFKFKDLVAKQHSTNTHTHAHMHTHARTHARTHTCTHLHAHTHAYTHTHTTHTHTHTPIHTVIPVLNSAGGSQFGALGVTWQAPNLTHHPPAPPEDDLGK